MPNSNFTSQLTRCHADVRYDLQGQVREEKSRCQAVATNILKQSSNQSHTKMDSCRVNINFTLIQLEKEPDSSILKTENTSTGTFVFDGVTPHSLAEYLRCVDKSANYDGMFSCQHVFTRTDLTNSGNGMHP
jgi:hypothetical protein